ncbi:RraA family protein [Salibacterium salarium]|uniref:Putative 4-hydroxy-4-methyl-2-oxoglutarate aldolase n=1 Tax=Salibacterium salarium TaxID=284579 RepID=A0A3R9PJ78_9BACI|nr:RraA family protein [Salibacterium salarium]RSL31934.1 RraA family protein [Salibacterium salarium]
MNIGFRVLPIINKLSNSFIESFRNIPTPLISDNLNRLQGTYSSIKPMHNSKKILGPALTVNTRAGDNLMVHKAIDIAEKGDVIVVDADGDMSQAIMGEIMLRLAEKKGISGFVIDGAIRDSKAFEERDYPCFAKGVTHRGPYKEGPGEINISITVGNMIVNPGDIIVGDEDGIVAVPLESAEEIRNLAKTQQDNERQTFQLIEENGVDRSWVDKTLKEKGCEML